ncbi:MAG: hypothetical protein ACKOC5_12195, partial [Chloroflexota bacterium]
EAIFDFTIPSGLRQVHVDNFKISLWTDSGVFTTPELAVFDWSTNGWLRLEGANQGVNVIPGQPGLVSPQGVVRVRIGAENAQSCYYLGLGLEGVR